MLFIPIASTRAGAADQICKPPRLTWLALRCGDANFIAWLVIDLKPKTVLEAGAGFQFFLSQWGSVQKLWKVAMSNLLLWETVWCFTWSFMDCNLWYDDCPLTHSILALSSVLTLLQKRRVWQGDAQQVAHLLSDQHRWAGVSFENELDRSWCSFTHRGPELKRQSNKQFTLMFSDCSAFFCQPQLHSGCVLFQYQT